MSNPKVFAIPNGNPITADPVTFCSTDVLIMYWLAKGLSKKKVSCKVNLGYDAVCQHIKAMYQQTDRHTLQGLVAYAYENKVLVVNNGITQIGININ